MTQSTSGKNRFSHIIADDAGAPELLHCAHTVGLPAAQSTYTPDHNHLSPQDQAEDRRFLRTLIALSLPIVFQSFISAAVNSGDVLILTYAGQTALSSVSLASQVSFVLSLFYFGLTTGAIILTAQYWGKRDILSIEKVLGLSLLCSIAISAAFFAISLCCPAWLMRVFTSDEALVTLGAKYLRVAGVSYLFMGISQVMLAVFKGCEHTRPSALISMACLIVDTILNATVIFLLFPGKTEMAVVGVAATTVMSRLLELTLCLWWGARRAQVKLRIRHILHTEAWVRMDFARCTLPVQLNYLIWGGALAATSALIGHIDSAMVSASSVALSVRNLALVVCTGLASGGSILLGKYLGAGRMALAKRAGNRLCAWSILLGAAAGLIVLAIHPLCLNFAALENNANELLRGMLFICAYYCVGKSFNSTLVGGIFCAGGDTKFGLACDAVAMWGVILPLGYLCAFVWKLPPLIVFFVLCLDEFVKMPVVALHYRKYRWLENLTRSEITKGESKI